MNRPTPLGGCEANETAVNKRQGLFARFSEQTGFGLSADDTAIFLLVVGLFSNWILSIATVFAFCVWVLLKKERIVSSFRARRSAIFIFSFVLAYLLRSLFLENFASALVLVGFVLYLLCGFYLRSVMTLRRFERILDTSILMGFYCAVYGLVDAYLIHGNEPSYLMQSSTNNANYYGLLLVCLIFAALYRLEEAFWHKNVAFYLSSVLLNFVMLLLTESVASYFGLILGLLLMLFLYRHFRTFFCLFVALIGIFILGFYLPGDPWNGRLLYPILERVEMWKIAWESITENLSNFLFGQGLFSYQEIWDNASHSFWDVRGVVPRSFQPHAHNLFLELILSFGILGFAILMLYYGAQMSLVLRRAAVRKLRPVSRFLFILCTAMAFANLADASLFWVQNGLWMLIVTAAAGIPPFDS